MQENQSNMLIYQTADGITKIETRLLDDTVWLTTNQICELFQNIDQLLATILNMYLHKENY